MGSSGKLINSADILDGSILAADFAAGSTFQKIAEASGDGVSAVIEFSSIPATYRHLQLMYIGRTTNAGTLSSIRMTFETTPTAGSYDYQQMDIAGTSLTGLESLGTADYITAGVLPAAASPANLHGSGIITLFDYANTNCMKATLVLNNGPSDFTTGNYGFRHSVGTWELTTAINRVRLTISNGNWTTTSRVTLYGIPG